MMGNGEPERAQVVLDQIIEPTFAAAGVDVALLRLDQYHALLSGNKYFKLKYNLRRAKALGCRRIVSFGGAFSNHIHALALAGQAEGLETVGIIRGEPSSANNATLSDAAAAGMALHFVDRATYRDKNTPTYLRQLEQQFPNSYIVPEGGGNVHGVRGCMDIATLINAATTNPVDTVVVAVGSGSTLAGIVAGFALGNSAAVTELMGISVLKNAFSLDRQVADHLAQMRGLEEWPAPWNPPQWRINHDFHGGGYAKVSRQLAHFIHYFKGHHSIELEPVYTGKLLLALYLLIDRGQIRNKNVVVVHSGGLQGLRGMRHQLDRHALPPGQSTTLAAILSQC